MVSYLPYYLEDYRGLSGTQIGLIMAVGPFVSLFAQPFWGYISDKYKTIKKILLLCVSGMLIFSFFLFQSVGFSMILLTIFLYYIFMSPVGALGDSFAQRVAVQNNTTFGPIRMWGSIGFALTSLLAGQLLVGNIGNLYYIYLFYVCIALIVCMFTVDVESVKTPVTILDAVKLVKNRHLLGFLAVIVFISISHRTNDNYLSLYITELGGDESLIGWAWFIAVATEAAVLATSGLWFRRFHPLSFIIFSGILYTFRWMLLGTISSPSLILMFQFLHGINFGLFYLSAFQYVTRLVPEHMQATGQLLLITVFFGFSGMVGSIGGGTILEHGGGSVLYYTMGGFALIGTVTVSIYKVRLGRRPSTDADGIAAG